MKPATRKLMRFCAWFGLGLCVLVVVLWVGSAGNRLYFDPAIWGSQGPPRAHELSLADHSLYILKGKIPCAWRILKETDRYDYVDRNSLQWRFWGSAQTEIDDSNVEHYTAIQIPLWFVLCAAASPTGWLYWRSRSRDARDKHLPMLPSLRAKAAFALCCLVFCVWAGSFFCYWHWDSLGWTSNEIGQTRVWQVTLLRQQLHIARHELSLTLLSWLSPASFYSEGVCDISFDLPNIRVVGRGLQPNVGPGWTVMLPMWMLTLLSALLTMFFCWRDRNTTWSQCRKCRYELIGNTSGRCPECGAAVPEGLRAALQTKEERRGVE